MKACRQCARLYPETARFCPDDGRELAPVADVPIVPHPDDVRMATTIGGRYQIRRVIADGGMGRVYEALDTHLDRNVAVKVLHAAIARDEVAVERIKREFEVSQHLPHLHIVDVFDCLPTEDGSWALVMEFLDGEELRAQIDRDPLRPERIIRIISQAAVALDEAHQRQLVHRDLKPDNLFLCDREDGSWVKILDFGSVKDKGERAKKLTVMGTTIGSPFYMAPEQAQGLETLDHRADVWALAAIAYECITGRVPFRGKNPPSILMEILTKEAPAPSAAAVGGRKVPPLVDKVMSHAFRKAPDLRIGSVGALADALGFAYGLSGDHRIWAATAEAKLAETIAARLPEMMQVAVVSDDVAADDFFGESGSLELIGARVVVDSAGAVSMASRPTGEPMHRSRTPSYRPPVGSRPSGRPPAMAAPHQARAAAMRSSDATLPAPPTGPRPADDTAAYTVPTSGPPMGLLVGLGLAVVAGLLGVVFWFGM